MRPPRGLQGRLGLFLGALFALLWLVTAIGTTIILRHEMDEVFDSALQETTQRLLPLAVVQIVGRGDAEAPLRVGTIRRHNEFYTYIVRNAEGDVLMRSHTADPAMFPPYDGPGFGRTATHRIYNEEALQGAIRISAAEPLDHRAEVARETRMGLGLPLVIALPIALLAIILAVRASLAPLRRFRASLDARDARDLTPVRADDLPAEIMPLADTLNSLLERLRGAFEAERNFAANAAHELRTPLAGAIAQAQRLKSETADADAARRAGDVEDMLKRLSRRTERLMQLARAEGGRLQTDATSDLRAAVQIVIKDMQHGVEAPDIRLTLPETPVLSHLDPDAVGIICRNLVENALRHGGAGRPVAVTLTPQGELVVANDGPVVPPGRLTRLRAPFRRGATAADGSGLGLSIVTAIAQRTGRTLTLRSPRPGAATGFEARIHLGCDMPVP